MRKIIKLLVLVVFFASYIGVVRVEAWETDPIDGCSNGDTQCCTTGSGSPGVKTCSNHTWGYCAFCGSGKICDNGACVWPPCECYEGQADICMNGDAYECDGCDWDLKDGCDYGCENGDCHECETGSSGCGEGSFINRPWTCVNPAWGENYKSYSTACDFGCDAGVCDGCNAGGYAGGKLPTCFSNAYGIPYTRWCNEAANPNAVAEKSCQFGCNGATGACYSET